MQTACQFLDAIRERYGYASDGQAARALGVTRACVSRWRHGVDGLSESTALRVAELLELEPAYVLACAAAERAGSEKARNVWRYVARMASGAACVAMAAAGIAGAPRPAGAAETGPGLYILLNRARRRLNNSRRRAPFVQSGAPLAPLMSSPRPPH